MAKVKATSRGNAKKTGAVIKKTAKKAAPKPRSARMSPAAQNRAHELGRKLIGRCDRRIPGLPFRCDLAAGHEGECQDRHECIAFSPSGWNYRPLKDGE